MIRNIIAEPKAWWRWDCFIFVLDGPTEDFWIALQMCRDTMGEKYNIRVTEEGDFSLKSARPIARTKTFFLDKN